MAPRNVHAETWPEGFRAKPLLPLPAPPVTPEPEQPAVHVMPMWSPFPGNLAQPVAEHAELHTDAASRKRRVANPRMPKATERFFADPFAEDDTGANCLRCGYLVEPAREKRSLTTCARCA